MRAERKGRQEGGRTVLTNFALKHGIMYQISLVLLWEVPYLAWKGGDTEKELEGNGWRSDLKVRI